MMMNAPLLHTTVMQMLTVRIPLDPGHVHVLQDTLEQDKSAQVGLGIIVHLLSSLRHVPGGPAIIICYF